MRKFLLCLTLLMLFAPAVRAAAPDSETDAQRAVRYNALLEKDPFSPDAPEMRKRLLNWLVETPDYTVNVCLDVLGPKHTKNTPHGAELVVQQMFGNVAYQITHPGQHDEVELQVAGMESTLRAYAAIIPGHPKWHIKYLDSMLKKQAKGELKSYLTPLVNKSCHKKDKNS